jgi:hypothetical protein
VSVVDPPFKVVDICIAEGVGWAYQPLVIEWPLTFGLDPSETPGKPTWLYGAMNVAKHKWRLCTERDLDVIVGAVRRDAQRQQELADLWESYRGRLRQPDTPPGKDER